MNSAVIPAIVEQHAEEAAFLWILRDAAVRAPHYRLKDLARLDDRVEAHLDGLRVAGAEGWRLCQDGLKIGESGEVFAATVLALESKDPRRIETVLDAAHRTAPSVRGLISAFGWVAPSGLAGTVKTLLASESPFLRQVGIAACAVHRVNPGAALDAALRDPASPPDLLSRALRAAGELHRRDLLYLVRERLTSDDESIRFSAARAAAMLGDREAAPDVLGAMVFAGSPYGPRALDLLVRCLDPGAAARWLKQLAGQPGRRRQLVAGAGILGDPRYVSWLIGQMREPALARVAGESFSMITGVDIAYADLEGNRPEGFESGPTESAEEEDVTMDEDENLPWPDATKIQAWWDRRGARFSAGLRYLAGEPLGEGQAREVLREGYQRQRAAAALELALLQSDAPYFEVRAPASRQQRLLSNPSS